MQKFLIQNIELIYIYFAYEKKKVYIFSIHNKISFKYILFKERDTKNFNLQCIIDLYAPYL